MNRMIRYIITFNTNEARIKRSGPPERVAERSIKNAMNPVMPPEMPLDMLRNRGRK